MNTIIMTDERIRLAIDLLGLDIDSPDPVARFALEMADEVLALRAKLREIAEKCLRDEDGECFIEADLESPEDQYDLGFHEGWLGALEMICDLAGEALEVED